MRELEDDKRRICVTVGMKVNLGNYESADASLCLSGLEPDATEEEIEAMLDTAKVAFGMMKTRLRQKCDELRQERSGRPLTGG